MNFNYSKEEIDTLFFMVLENEFSITRERFYANPELRMSESELLIMNRVILKLNRGIPIQYILGWTDFDGLRLKVDHRVLIPRPETEELVNLIYAQEMDKPLRILDVGTGSGCIALALKRKFPHAKVTAIEESPDAIDVAHFNASNTGIEIDIVRNNVLNTEWTKGLQTIDIVVSNPPYVLEEESKELQKQVVDHEPHIALFAPKGDPLSFYKHIGKGSLEILSDRGALYFECHENYAYEVEELLLKIGYHSVRVYEDFRGKNRFIRAVKN